MADKKKKYLRTTKNPDGSQQYVRGDSQKEKKKLSAELDKKATSSYLKAVNNSKSSKETKDKLEKAARLSRASDAEKSRKKTSKYLKKRGSK